MIEWGKKKGVQGIWKEVKMGKSGNSDREGDKSEGVYYGILLTIISRITDKMGKDHSQS